jgi:4-hydroxyphenylpyruvate dioxygenase
MVMIEEKVLPISDQSSLVLKGYHHLEFYVGNAKQAAHYYRTAFGLPLVAYSGLETGARNRVSYVLGQNDIRIVLTSSLRPDDEIASHVRRHGDGVKDIAFAVDHVEAAYNEALNRGARPVMEPVVIEDDGGQIIKASIGVFGDTVHSFIERKDYAGQFMPGFRAVENGPPPPFETELTEIDHLAISIPEGQLDEWVEFYENTLGFHESHREDVATEYSAMNSKVVQSKTGAIKLPLVEPATGKRKSQIEEYIDYYDGPGVQHVALLSGDIVETVKAWRGAGNEFLKVPGAYYEMLPDRVGMIDEDVEELQAEQILVDRDEWGYLMQIFTRPIQSRPTVFMEAIQRHGARGFGSGNIKALFAAVELDQAKRGNL